ncbi:MAG: DUF4184 family protein [Chloroflexi bacterium]|nr:DUF4184 family protein [Chloroflexota bacterium]
MPATFPSPFPAHQGLLFPVARKWPAYFDVIALSVGAAMPDLIDITLGFLSIGYFKQWYAHSLIGAAVVDIPGGLMLTWLVTAIVARLSKNQAVAHNGHGWRTRPGVWSFSVVVGVLSHLGFDLISHETNLLLYPWYENVRWFPEWWYTPWITVKLIPMLGNSYSVGIHSAIWFILSVTGTILFYQFIFSRKPKVDNYDG